eukprot:CAMPEP_0115329180 /NCGR_PEP_ID=MMETSP0270-20121206/85089_1 /TAXON_ID=71861 /ORGANISM="Scrippsiella trochoidea, Strain CCMP3099" /LENGTH=111 /DNA_ID=CAMNT_0002749777 /DNA_START=69 /DNA_END=404 /DNA_ORIENTATION=+
MAGKRSPLAAVLLVAAAAALLLGTCGPAFVPAARTGAGMEQQQVFEIDGLSWVVPTAAAASIAAAPLAVQAADGLPTPVLGIGMLSVVVVIVLLISGVAIGRGLVETIDDL